MISIKDGKPLDTGLYVVYVDTSLRHAKRMFLMWHLDQWWYPHSDQPYRGHVYGWVGPLPALELTNDETQPNSN